MKPYSHRTLPAAALAAVLAAALLPAPAARAQTAIVDGMGGMPTIDPIFIHSYATILDALADVQTLEPAGGSTILLTVAATTETAGLNLNVDENLTITSIYPGGTNVRIVPSTIGLSSASAAIVANTANNRSITLQNLIVTPASGPAGVVAAHGVQFYGRSAAPPAGTTYTLNIDNCIFTALLVATDQPVLNPFEHAATTNTLAARNAQLRSFAGSVDNLITLYWVSGSEGNSLARLNLTNTVVTHTLYSGFGMAGGGVGIARTAGFELNVGPGCVFTYNAGAAIRNNFLMTGSMPFNVIGTEANPVFVCHNGWTESVVPENTAGIFSNGCTLTVRHVYTIGNYGAGIDKRGNGNVLIEQTYAAENQSDLDTTSGTPPDADTAADIHLANGLVSNTLTSCTLYNNRAAGANGRVLRWPGTVATSALILHNVVMAGEDDRVIIGGTAAVSYTETNCAVVQSGPDALASPYITLGLGVVGPAPADRVTGDPEFMQTAFTPVWAGLGVKPGGLDNYLAVGTAAYHASRGGTAPENVVGANANSPVPVALSAFAAE